MSEKRSSTTKKRCQRISNFQKMNLVSLVQNFFVRSHGHCSNVNFDEINSANWERMASILNSMGPSKTGNQWKSTLYYMRNRIRKKVKLIRQCGGSLHSNLSETDLKIHDMLPVCNNEVHDDYDNTLDLKDPVMHDGLHDADDDDVSQDVENVDTTANRDEFYSELVKEFEQENCDQESDPEIDGEQDTAHEKVTLDNAVVDSSRTLIVETLEDLNAYMNDPIIEEDSGNHSPSNEFLDSIAEIDFSFPQLSPSSRHTTATDRIQSIHLPRTVDRPMTIRRPSINLSPSINDPPFINRPPFVNHNQPEELVNPSSGKTRVWVSEIQKERLVQLVQNNFLKAMGRYAGSNGTFIKAQLWQSIATELNTLGPKRSAEQWKTTLNAIKSSAKAKLADMHNNFNGSVGKPLTRLEEKIVSIYGMDNMDGQQTLGESGFQYKKTIPATVTRPAESGPLNPEGEDDEDFGQPSRNEQTNEESVSEDIPLETQRVTDGNEAETETFVNDLNDFGQSSTNQQTNDEILEEILREIRGEPNADDDSTVNELDVAILAANTRISGHESATTRQLGTTRQSGSTHQSGAPRQSDAARQSGLTRQPGAHRQSVAARQSQSVAARQSESVAAHQSRQSSSISSTNQQTDDEILEEILREIRDEPNADDDSTVNELDVAILAANTRISGHESATTRQLGTTRQSGSTLQSGAPRQSDAARQSQSSAARQSQSAAARQSQSVAARQSQSISARQSQSVAARQSRAPCQSDARQTGEVRQSSGPARPAGRRNFAPPRRSRRNGRHSSEIEHITDINQLFNDDEDSEDDHRSMQSENRENRDNGTGGRDRSNLRNSHTSFEMVQTSMSSQRNFIEDTNRNHAEMMYLNNRNHSEIIGMFNSTLSALVDVALLTLFGNENCLK